MKPVVRTLLILLLLTLAAPVAALADETASSMWEVTEETPPPSDANTKELFGYSITVPESLNKANLLTTGRKLLKYLPYHDDVVEFGSQTKVKIRSHIDGAQATADDLFTKADALQAAADELLTREHWAGKLDGLAADVQEHEIVASALDTYESIREPVVTIINNPLEAPGVKGAWETYENIKEPITTIINDPMQAPGLKQVSGASQKFTSGLKKKLIIAVIIIVVILIIIKVIMGIISNIRGKMLYKAAHFAVKTGAGQIKKRRDARQGSSPASGEAQLHGDGVNENQGTDGRPRQPAAQNDLPTEAIQAGLALLHEIKDTLHMRNEGKRGLGEDHGPVAGDEQPYGDAANENQSTDGLPVAGAAQPRQTAGPTNNDDVNANRSTDGLPGSSAQSAPARREEELRPHVPSTAKRRNNVKRFQRKSTPEDK